MAAPVSSSLEQPAQQRRARKAWGARAGAKLRLDWYRAAAAAVAVAVGGGRPHFRVVFCLAAQGSCTGQFATRVGSRRPADVPVTQQAAGTIQASRSVAGRVGAEAAAQGGRS